MTEFVWAKQYATLAVAEKGQCSHNLDRSDIDGAAQSEQLLSVKTGIDHREFTLPDSILQLQ